MKFRPWTAAHGWRVEAFFNGWGREGGDLADTENLKFCKLRYEKNPQKTKSYFRILNNFVKIDRILYDFSKMIWYNRDHNGPTGPILNKGERTMKKTTMRRSLALLLAVVLCIGLLPVSVLAARVETDEISIEAPDGTETLAVQPDGSSDAEGPGALTSEDEVAPVHYYTFDEDAGEAAADSGTNKVAGVKSGAVGSAEGKAGNAATFDGASFIDVADKAILNGDNFTVAAWINWNGNGKVNAIVSNSISASTSTNGMFF